MNRMTMTFDDIDGGDSNLIIIKVIPNYKGNPIGYEVNSPRL